MGDDIWRERRRNAPGGGLDEEDFFICGVGMMKLIKLKNKVHQWSNLLSLLFSSTNAFRFISIWSLILSIIWSSIFLIESASSHNLTISFSSRARRSMASMGRFGSLPFPCLSNCSLKLVYMFRRA